MTSDAEQQSKARVFISYSRKDMAFSGRPDGRLKARSFEPLIDRTDIYAFEEWWKRVAASAALRISAASPFAATGWPEASSLLYIS